MKFTKMSLVAALLIGSSAFAIENTKVSGDAKVYYNTSDANNGDLLNAANSAADIGLNLNATTDLMKSDMVSVSAGAGLTVLTTLGLENNLVNGVWGGAHTVTTPTGSSLDPLKTGGVKVDNAWWVNEAWMAATAGKTTLKVGRMALDTPLAFTEKWTIEQNTFEAAVLLNTDIPDTTLVGAYIGNGNGTEKLGQDLQSNAYKLGVAAAGVVNGNGEFATYGTNGAYAVGAINNSFEPLTLQAWYYDVTRVVEAYWLQADLNMAGVIVGAQYSAHTIDKDVAADVSSDVYAIMLGYEMKDTFAAKVAYSQVGKDFAAGFNTATASETVANGVAGKAQSKLYTEAFWGGNFGKVTAADTKTLKVCASTPANGIADLRASYTNADNATAGADMTEIALSASKTFGPLDATVAYINTDTDAANVDASNAIQVYLTANF